MVLDPQIEAALGPIKPENTRPIWPGLANIELTCPLNPKKASKALVQWSSCWPWPTKKKKVVGLALSGVVCSIPQG